MWNGTFWEKDRGSGYGAVNPQPPIFVPKAVESVGEGTPLLAVVQGTRSELMGASGSVPRVSETVDITTERATPASSVATTSVATQFQGSPHQPHIRDPGSEEEEEAEGAPDIGPPTLLPPPPPLPKKPSPRLAQSQRPPPDDGDQPSWFSSQLECAICLSQFEVGDRVRVLPCGHIFHLQEVDEWLVRQRKVVCIIPFFEFVRY